MNKLYHYLFGDNVANYVLLFINPGWSRILRRISKSHELDCWTKTKRKVYWSLDWCFPRRFMGTLARQNRFIFKIQFQQKIHSILHYCSTFSSKIKGSVILGDHFFVGNRKGGDQVIFNTLRLNNNLFKANLQSLVDNFNVLNRKFTP